MRLIAAALLFMAVAAPALAADAVMPPVAFRDAMARAMTAWTGNAVEMVDDKTYKTKGRDGIEVTINIDNAYAQYLADPEKRDEIIARFVRLLGTSSDDGKAETAQLVVIVRPSDYIKASLPAGAKLDGFVPPRPMAGDLSFFLAVDSPETIRTASMDDLKRWKIDEAAAWKLAVANIREHVGEIGMFQLGDPNGPTGIEAESGLAPSILADPTFCGPNAPDGTDGQVVLLLARDMFLFALPADKEQMDRFWKGAKAEIAGRHSLSSTPLTCHDGHWVVAKAP